MQKLWALSAGAVVLLGTATSAQAADFTKPVPRLLAPVAVTVAPNFLGTTALPIRADRFAASWANARQDASQSPLLQRLIAPARALGRLQQLAYVQNAIQHAVRWGSDATEWGQHDYWASAAQTLSHGAGDMEDRAIVKMQALRALGFSPSDLFLTLARDRVSGPITVLTTRVGNRYYILDDTGGAPFAAESRRFEFQPVMSFGWNGTWVHARRQPATQTLASRSLTLTGK